MTGEKLSDTLTITVGGDVLKQYAIRDISGNSIIHYHTVDPSVPAINDILLQCAGEREFKYSDEQVFRLVLAQIQNGGENPSPGLYPIKAPSALAKACGR